MSKTLEDLANLFEVDLPDDLSPLRAPSCVDLPKGILRQPSTIAYALKQVCEANYKIAHVCEPLQAKPK